MRAMTMHDEMNEDRRELIRGLFVVATELVEQAHEIATNGQSAAMTVDEYRICADKLYSITSDIEALANSVHALLRTGQ